MRRRSVWLAALLGLVLLAFGIPSAGAATGDGSRQSNPAGGRHHHRSYTLLQMNLCLSGIAGCYPGTHYPAVVDEAIAKIRKHEPDAATLVETCEGDAERIADATGYHLAFGTVIYRGEPLPCVDPTGRGVYGITVLTRKPIVATNDHAYRAQHGNEERRRVCATTVDRATACVTHLAVRNSDPAGPDSVANDAQCAEFGRLLASYARRGNPVIGAGDMNRDASCAPHGFWTKTDEGAAQLGGIQHAYGSQRALHRPRARVLPMTYSDHDALLVTARR
ncbi:MAG: endonuclease/exonuclease/phosphatase family protein [Nocardioidaceae bacterium]